MALVKKDEAKKPEVPETIGKIFGLRGPAVGKSCLTAVKTTNDSLLTGVELEIENLPNGHGWYVDRVDGSPWGVEEDGSLRPRGEAWEFISHPLPLSYQIPEVEALFPKINVTEENYSDRCSVHVHTNVLDWTRDNLAGLALVYPVFENVLFKYVNHYKKKEEQGYCRDTNLYCIPWSDCRHNRSFVDNLFNNPGQIRNWQKYTALNFLPILEKGTVEWRHMHGTCDMEKLTTWFNLIGAIMAYSKTTPFHDIVSRILILNDVSTYQQFYEEVLKGTLPYSEDYRRSMAEGVVNAKYSLVNWERNKGNPKKAEKYIFGENWGIGEVIPEPPLNFANLGDAIDVAGQLAAEQRAFRDGIAAVRNPMIRGARLDPIAPPRGAERGIPVNRIRPR